TATLNGERIDVQAEVKDGYLSIDRTWSEGDTLELDLAIEPRRVYAHPNVASASGKTALHYGPLVFCLEGVDHDSPVRSLALARHTKLTARPDERTGTVTLHAAASAPISMPELYAATVPESRAEELTAVPYFS
ncbi:hypothetical protein ABQG64_24905, partial [Escherichia coli]